MEIEIINVDQKSSPEDSIRGKVIEMGRRPNRHVQKLTFLLYIIYCGSKVCLKCMNKKLVKLQEEQSI